MVGFKVDTKLFQELGELLVAKESTALVELIKNAYDADASEVIVHGEYLDDLEKGKIVVKDDGLGMSDEEFQRGFLTIAGRTKITEDRRSPIFGRRYTGEKGVGRLAAHKLGKRLEIVSHKAGPRKIRGAIPPAVSTIRAIIDWAAIEKFETLDKLGGSDAVTVHSLRTPKGAASGTKLTISPIRARWGQRIRRDFFKEVVTITPASALWERLPPSVVSAPLLFDRIPVRDQRTGDTGFHIRFSGELAEVDSLIPDVVEAAGWIAEIDFSQETGLLNIAVAPTKGTLAQYPASERFAFQRVLRPGAGPSFCARIFQRSNTAWPSPVQGVRIFMEGFRVSPYGDSSDDWLDLDRSYRSRAARKLSSLSKLEGLPEGLENEEQVIQGNAAYMGAVFLHRADSEGHLKMLVNREGFLPGPGFNFISEWVRVAIDLIVRLGYAGRREVKKQKREDRDQRRDAASRADVSEAPSALRVREDAVAAQRAVQRIHRALEDNDLGNAEAAAREAIPRLTRIRELADEFGGEAVMWRVLASLGTELAAFVHEVRAIGMQIQALIVDLDDALQRNSINEVRKSINRARRRAVELSDRIKRNAAYLIDATSFEGRRRRSRQVLHDRFEAALIFFATRISQKRIEVSNLIPPDLKSPPMFPAELSGIFTNLLSNAVKFTNEGGKIVVRARLTQDAMVVRMENSGVRVDLSQAPKLFEAYQSTTERPDAILGQGMGMGLTITRAFIQEYGGDISFVRPTSGFATAIEFLIPLR